MKRQLLTFELPFLVSAEDYHEFDDKVSLIQSLVGKDAQIQHEELFCEGKYFAVIFDKNNKPSLDDVIELVVSKKFTPEFLEEFGFSYNNVTPTIDEIKIIAQKVKLNNTIKKNEVVRKSHKI